MFRERRITPELILVAIAGLLALFVVVIAVFSFFANSQKGTQAPVTKLSHQEKSYPHATPQPFRHAEAKDTGTLVVTSDIPAVTVMLDAEEHPDPQDPIQGKKWPKNITPFTVTMPVGSHVLLAAKPPMYDIASYTFEIKKNQVTHVSIHLVPLQTSK
jgi:hypothetical protein